MSWKGEGGIAHMRMRLVMALLTAVAYFLSDPGPIIVYPSQWLTDWLTHWLTD